MTTEPETWRAIAKSQGQPRLPNETTDHYRDRVLKLYDTRKRNKHVEEWRKDVSHD